MIRAIVVLVLLAGAALADDNKAQAVALFEEGQKEMKAGNYERACDAFLRSDRLHPDSGTRGSLARCYEKQGRVASSWRMWTELSKTAPERLRPDAAANAKKLEPRLPKYVIRAPKGQQFRATIDGLEVDPTPDVEQPIDSGKHVFGADADGYSTFQHAFVAVEGKTEEITIPFTPSVTPSLPPVKTDKTSSAKRTYGVIVMGVGGAILVGGTVLGVVARGRFDDAKDLCGGDIDSCDPLRVEAAQDKVDSARSAGTFATGAFIAGGITLAAGIYLFVTGPKSRSDVAISPAIGNDGAGVIVRGGF